jgi:hypothetical protein
MNDRRKPLFAQGDLAAFLERRLERAAAEIRPARRHPPADVVRARIARFEARHQLAPPRILSGARVVEQGALDGGQPQTTPALVPAPDPAAFSTRREYLGARIRHLEARLKHASPRTFALIDVPFEGAAELFDYCPTGCRLPAPSAEVRDGALRLRLECSGPHDPEWRAQLQSDLLQIERFLLHTRREVAAFNRTVSQAIRAAQRPPPPRKPGEA